MINKNLDIYFSISLISIPILLLTGPFLPDLILSLSAITFLIFVIKKKKINLFNNYFCKFFLLFLIIIIINSLISENTKSIISSLGYFRFLIFIFLVYYLLKHTKFDLYKYLFYLITVCYFYLIFEFFFQFYLQETIFGQPVSNPTRLVLSSFHHEQIYSSYIVRFYPIFLGLYFLLKDKLSNNLRFLFYFINFFIVTSVLFNGERTAIGLLVFSLVYIFLFIKAKKLSKFIIFGFSLISILLLFSSLPKKNFDRKISGFKDFKQTYENFKDDKSELIFLSDKYNSLYRTSYNIFLKNKAFGIGIKNFRVECGKEIYAYDKRSCSTHPHNIILQILAETGFVGILYYITIIFFLIYFLINNLINKNISDSKKNYITCLFLSVFISLFPFFPSGNIFNNWISIIIYFPIGFIIKEIFESKKLK